MPPEEEIKRQQKAILADENCRKLDELAKNPSFEWFLKEVIQPIVDAEQKAALDKSVPADTRNLHVHRLDLGNQILSAFKKEHLRWSNLAKNSRET